VTRLISRVPWLVQTRDDFSLDLDHFGAEGMVSTPLTGTFAEFNQLFDTSTVKRLAAGISPAP
jgi:hypothetical protein